MKYTLLSLVVVALCAAGCQSNRAVDAGPAPATAASASGTSMATLIVHGMGCPLCANNIDKQLLAIPGVERVNVDLGSGAVQVTMGGTNRPTSEQLAAAVQQSGYTLVRIDMP